LTTSSKDGITAPKLVYWIPKYILMKNDKPFSQLGYISPKLLCLAESQDKIGWRNFREGYISIQFYNIWKIHLAMLNSYLNGRDWTKQFISKLLHLMHSQWIHCNISLQDRRQGYLCNKQAADLLREIQELSELSPNKVPESSRFLLEINFTELTRSHIETQWYWTLIVHAALKAKQLEDKRGGRLKQICKRLNKNLHSRKKFGIMAVEQQLGWTACISSPELQTATTTATKQH
jgi:hypothetical protein